MPVERRGWAICVTAGVVNWQQEEPSGRGGRRQLARGGTSRVTGDSHARICESLGVKFPGPTRPKGRVVKGEFQPFDPHNTRLFFAPTARALRRGEGYAGVYEVVLPFVQVGITD